MRRILVESARRKARLKRGGQWQRIDLEDVNLAIDIDSENLLTIDEALTKFAAEDPVKAQLVSLRFFAGLSLREAAQAITFLWQRRNASGPSPVRGFNGRKRRPLKISK